MGREVTDKSSRQPDESSAMRYIPVSLPELIKGLLGEKPLQETTERNAFARFSELLQALYHTHYFERYRDLNRYYQPFNPDQDTTTLEDWSENDRVCFQNKLFKDLQLLLKKANYDELDEALINESLSQQLSKNLSTDVEMDDFEKIIFFVRGHGIKKTKKRNWRHLLLTSTIEEVATYQRLCVVFRFQTEEKLRENLKQRGMSRFSIWRHVLHHRAVIETKASRDYIFLRLFRDVPKSNLEMLFPNSKIHFTVLDNIKPSVTGRARTVGGIWVLLSKLAIAVKPLTMLIALFDFARIVGRQVSNVLHHQTNYQKVLSRSLYTHSLDINVGVISSLIDHARDEDIKEALLAYYFLMRAGEAGMSINALDRKIEQHLMMRYGFFMDFEVDDAVVKLKRSGLVTENTSGIFHAVSLEAAGKMLVDQWEDIFSVAKRLSLLGSI